MSDEGGQAARRELRKIVANRLESRCGQPLLERVGAREIQLRLPVKRGRSRSVEILAEAEIIRPGEILSRTIEPACGEQFLAPDQAQRLPQLDANQALTALTTNARQ